MRCGFGGDVFVNCNNLSIFGEHSEVIHNEVELSTEYGPLSTPVWGHMVNLFWHRVFP